jgi:hypothetical protein
VSGKYLRKRVPGQPQDPTMTHVDDPWAFKVGDVIQGHYGWDLILALDDNMLGNPDIRFAHLQEIDPRSLKGHEIIHDVRENEIETFPYGAVNSDGSQVTRGQAQKHFRKYGIQD